MSTTSTQLVPLGAVDDTFRRAWRELETRAAEPNPFQGIDFVTASARRFGQRTMLLTVGSADRLDALWALSWPLRVPIRGALRLPVPALQVLTEPYAQLGTPLVSGDRLDEAVAGLLRWPQRRAAPLLAVRYLGDDGPVAAALDGALSARGQRGLRVKTYQRAALVGQGVGGSKNQRSRRAKIRKLQGPMAAALGPVEVLDRSDDPQAVADFLALEAAGWKGAAGTALGSRPESAAWFADVCRAARAHDELEILDLRAGGRTAAMQFNVRRGGSVFHVKSCYDESLGDHQPGAQLLVHNVDVMPGGGPVQVRDSVTVPDNTLMNQVWDGRLTFSTVLLPAAGPAGSAAIAAAERAIALVRSRRG